MQSAKLLKDNVFVDINIKVDAHRSPNTRKGVISARYFLSCTEEEILGESKIRVRPVSGESTSFETVTRDPPEP